MGRCYIVKHPEPAYTARTGKPLTPMMQALYDEIVKSPISCEQLSELSGVSLQSFRNWFYRGWLASTVNYEAVVIALGLNVRLVRVVS